MIFVTGDLHGNYDISKLSSKNWIESKCSTRDDYLIILGDFGLIWNNTQSKDEKYWLDWLNNKPYTTLFLDGNHENHVILSNYPTIKKFNGEARQIQENIFHLKRGEVYTIDNQKIFIMGGATSIDKAWRTPWISWWVDEIPTREEFHHALDNIEKHKYVDFILSHACPESIKENFLPGIKHDLNCPVEKFLDIVKEDLNYKKWYFGHYHQDKQLDNKHICLYHKIIQLGDNLK